MDLGQNSNTLDPTKSISCRKQTSRLTQSCSRLGNPERLNLYCGLGMRDVFPDPGTQGARQCLFKKSVQWAGA